jgi:hypothetical protein
VCWRDIAVLRPEMPLPVTRMLRGRGIVDVCGEVFVMGIVK